MNSIQNKSSETLLGDLKKMVAEERKLLTEILHHVKEVEDRHFAIGETRVSSTIGGDFRPKL